LVSVAACEQRSEKSERFLNPFFAIFINSTRPCQFSISQTRPSLGTTRSILNCVKSINIMRHKVFEWPLPFYSKRKICVGSKLSHSRTPG
jgi:hypothetical protein